MIQKRKKSEFDRMHEKCMAYFQPVGELETSLVETIAQETVRCKQLFKQADVAEDTLDYSVRVLNKVQLTRIGPAAPTAPTGKVPQVQIQ